ncbi:hypothetical protein [Pseudoduganella lutea]|uniref:Uncharacterized protein n=1 Tax=Pseudoduganella lutea TaxID=321985 RepID=A0A4P6KRB9_9BURK|nr:hypothetical protein [Pseudoduganella lutea]QBE61611.1 hypothetical protein EWM63_00140 [Pseudoduganella lutea]
MHNPLVAHACAAPPATVPAALRTASGPLARTVFRTVSRWSAATVRRCLALFAALLPALLLAAVGGTAHALPDLADHVAIAVDTPVPGTANVSDSVVTVTNTSTMPIAAPFTLTIARSMTPGVAVAYPTSLDHAGLAGIAVPLPLGVLEPGAQVSVPVRFANPQRRQFTFEARATGTLLAPETAVPLEVTVYHFSGDPANPRGAPAGAGVGIVVDGVLRARTDANGRAALLVPATLQAITARLAPVSTGIARLALVPGMAHSTDIVLTDGGQVYADATLRFDAVMQSLLPAGQRTLTGRFIAPDGSTVRLAHLGSVELRDADRDDEDQNVTGKFVLNADGTVYCRDTAVLQARAANGHAMVVVTGTDALGNVYRGAVNMVQASVVPKGMLAPPVAEPGLDLAGITVTGTSTRKGKTVAVYTAVADAAGNFTLPAAPQQGLSLSAHAVRNGRHYTAASVIDPGRAATFRLPLHGGAELRRAQPDPDATAASINIMRDWGDPDVNSSTMIVPRGTQHVTLSYLSSAAPDDMDAVRDVRVVAGPAGTPLYGAAHHYASHPYDYAQATYMSMLVARQLDVAALAADGPLELTLYANLSGAWKGRQRIEATLGAGTPLILESATIGDDFHITHGRRHISMPEPGEANLIQRRVRLAVRKSAGMEITNVKVDLANQYMAEYELNYGLLTVLDAPPGPDVVVDGSTIDTVVSFTAPHGHDLRALDYRMVMHYQVTVTARAPDGTEAKATGLVTGIWPLWRAPAGLARYGLREAGGDDWVSGATHDWLVAHADAVTAIDDCAGEHGTDLGHPSHGSGNEFDMYHFYTFPGADPESGTSNYRQLVARILDLPLLRSSDPEQSAAGKAAAAQVQAWIRASRSGIDKLYRAGVAQVGYILGGPDAAGIGGMDWGYKLLTTGRVTVNGVVHDLGMGAWNNAVYYPLPNHHHHMHVALRPDAWF